ncbi:MAG: hypothetical protein CL610_30120 [Anaerolineaceae bacterium]|nr:hypothetical protein [Anaerolineaceae bacterium]
MDYSAAVEQLKSPSTWCKGAAALAEIGESQALVPLMQAYETPGEASRGCLLDAMDALDPVAGALEMVNADDDEVRRLGVHLMELFPDERYLEMLERMITRETGPVHRQALRTLTTQYQTAAWEAIVARLLASDDLDVRTMAVDHLARRTTDSAADALRSHLPHETNPDLKARIEQSL